MLQNISGQGHNNFWRFSNMTEYFIDFENSVSPNTKKKKNRKQFKLLPLPLKWNFVRQNFRTDSFQDHSDKRELKISIKKKQFAVETWGDLVLERCGLVRDWGSVN